jgi:hypothetical protein
LECSLHAWKVQILAYFDTHGVSNGGTEAINLIIERSADSPTDSKILIIIGSGSCLSQSRKPTPTLDLRSLQGLSAMRPERTRRTLAARTTSKATVEKSSNQPYHKGFAGSYLGIRRSLSHSDNGHQPGRCL